MSLPNMFYYSMPKPQSAHLWEHLIYSFKATLKMSYRDFIDQDDKLASHHYIDTKAKICITGTF